MPSAGINTHWSAPVSTRKDTFVWSMPSRGKMRRPSTKGRPDVLPNLPVIDIAEARVPVSADLGLCNGLRCFAWEDAEHPCSRGVQEGCPHLPPPDRRRSLPISSGTDLSSVHAQTKAAEWTCGNSGDRGKLLPDFQPFLATSSDHQRL